MKLLSILTFLLFCLGLVPEAASAQQCQIVEHAIDDQTALNNFWHTSIPICHIPDGSHNAYANRQAGVVLADQAWLDEIAYQYGSWAATGILAHEWGHMVQGMVSGTAAELQADCLAGLFMRGAGLSPQRIVQFARSNLVAGDKEWSFGGHGTSMQRVNAAWRGYTYFSGNMNPQALLTICPLSAF